jgi:hypothetical protein
MGLNIATLQFIEQHVDVSGKRICMYGNLYLKKGTDEIQKRLGTKLASAYFLDRGASEVVMLDTNGKDGALPVDLSKPIKDLDLLGSFDLLLDGGTTEHVKNQRNCFKNAFDLCKPGALMIHMLPAVGSWPNHCYNHYSIESFSQLAKQCGYEIIDLYITDWVSKRTGKLNDLVFVCLKKAQGAKFLWKI